ncbi:GPR1/FUN34/YaaH family transporter [Streptomyces sp. NPDC052077]|uniref:GPR1/FUN34/YaaH family transporter n=1 Tax=Streptomyces sp. NPDC052077 TaxID=3154757 RepID=UPI003435B5F0
MDQHVSAGSTTTIVGRLALGVTLLAFGLGHTAVIDGVTAGDAVTLARHVGGIALFLVGLLALRDGDTASGTAFTAFGALWFTWASAASGGRVSANAAGLFLLLFALVALSLAAADGDLLTRGGHGLFAVSLLLIAVAVFSESTALVKAGGWFAVAAGAVVWYSATAALAHWPTALPRGRAGRRATAA